MRCPFRPERNVIYLILARMKWSSHFGQNEMAISFRPKWNDHFILTEMKWKPFHSGQNEMSILARTKSNSFHSGQNEIKFISFRPEWNCHLILTEMKCHFFDSMKKYAARKLCLSRMWRNESLFVHQAREAGGFQESLDEVCCADSESPACMAHILNISLSGTPGQKNLPLTRSLMPSALRWVLWSSLTSSWRKPLGMRILVPFLMTSLPLPSELMLRSSQQDLSCRNSDSLLIWLMSPCCTI